MKIDRKKQMRRFLLAYALLLTLFLAIADLLIYQQQQNSLYTEFKDTQKTELHLMGLLTQEAMLQEDYALIEWFVRQWGKKREEVVTLRAVAPNGFVIVDYQRMDPATETITFTHKVDHSGDLVMKLELVSDTRGMNRLLNTLLLKLLGGSVVLMLLMAIAVWFVLQRLAIRPLEVEIGRRHQVEAKLRELHQQNQLLLESAGEGIFSLNQDGVCVFINDLALGLLGHKREEIIGVMMHEIIHHTFFFCL